MLPSSRTRRRARLGGTTIRVVFMGSPSFAVPALEKLMETGHEIRLVVSQPDRPAGRRQQLRPSPIAHLSRERGLPLYQPEALRSPIEIEPIRSAEPEVIVVVAYGLYLPRMLRDLSPPGVLNVHPSLLPRHRGAAPVQAAILAGDAETGVSLMELTARMDAGPVIAQVRTPIHESDDTPVLEARLARMGADLLAEKLEPWARGRVRAVPQAEEEATYTPKIRREDARLDWREPAEVLWRRVRAYRGWPDAYTYWAGRMLKILEAAPLPSVRTDEPTGTVRRVRPPDTRADWPAVTTVQGALLLRKVVLEGRKPVPGDAFLHGQPDFAGAELE